MGKQRRHFTPAEKAKARRHLAEKAPISSPREESRNHAMADTMGQSLEHRSNEKQLLEYLFMEKNRIGQHLHDHLCQQLTGIAFMLQVLEQDLLGKSTPEAQDAAKIMEVVDLAVTQTRGLTGVLSSGALKGENLIPALQEMAFGFERLFNISCQFSPDRDVRLQRDENAWPLYSLAQEAAHFALRYHDAKAIEIKLRQSHDAIILSIDCETGPNPRGPERHRKISKWMIKYFADLIHATLKTRRYKDRYALRCTFRNQ